MINRAVLALERRSTRTCLVLLSLTAASDWGRGEPICITCSAPRHDTRCEISNAQSIEELPFGPEVLGKACTLAIKANARTSGCRVLKNASCNDWPVTRISIRQAKQALLGRLPVPQDDAAPAPPKEVQETSVWSAVYRPVTDAWSKFLALFASR